MVDARNGPRGSDGGTTGFDAAGVGTTATAAIRLGPGSRLGPFEIAGMVASGGMGEVYRARDTRLGRDVAIKVLPTGLAADPERRRRFEHEARAASALSHPNICTIHDIGREGAVDYLVMEYLEGQTLEGRLRAGPLPLDQALFIAEQIADALAAAHRQGIVHRDLKPGNVMLTSGSGRREGPHAKLLDFGLAKLKRGDGAASGGRSTSTLTGEGAILGTLHYMAPEQLEGGAVDARSDIWALGATLYEMVTGQRPFEGSSRASLIARIMSAEPPPIVALKPVAPAPLDRLVRQCLSKSPDDRPDTAHDVANELRRLRETSLGGQVASSAGRARRGGWLAILAVIAAIAVAAIWVLRREASPRAGLAFADTFDAPVAVTSAPGWEDQPALSPDGTLVAYVSNESGTPDVWIAGVRGGNRVQVTNDEATDARPAWFPDGTAIAYATNRGGAWSIWKASAPLGGSSAPILADARDPAISPDGASIAFVRPDANGCPRVHVAKLAGTGGARPVSTAGGNACRAEGEAHPAWSPDGREVCFSGDRALWIANVASGTTRRLTGGGEYDIEPAWSTDGTIFFTSCRQGTCALWRIPASGPGQAQRVTRGAGPERNATLSRDGRAFAFSSFSRNQDLVIRDIATGREETYGTTRDEDSPTLSPDGGSLVFAVERQAESGTELWRQPLIDWRPSGSPVQLTTQSGSSSHPEYSPDGRWIAFFRVLDGRRSVWVMPADGGPPVRLSTSPADEIHPTWSPDGRHVAFCSLRAGGPDVWVVAVADGKPVGEPRRVTSGPGGRLFPAWSPDGRWIASVVGADPEGGEIALVAADGSAPERRVTHGAGAHAVRWVPGRPAMAVAGRWGGRSVLVRSVSLDGVVDPSTPPLADIGPRPVTPVFDLSRDGRHIVFSRGRLSGDVWVSALAK